MPTRYLSGRRPGWRSSGCALGLANADNHCRRRGRPQRPRAYGLLASAGAIAVAAGPLIGGLFTTYLSWRWVFAGEVLVVLIILGLTRRIGDTPPEVGALLDLVGTALSALGLGLVVYGILRAGTWGFVQPKPGAPQWLGLSQVIWLILAGGVVLRVFMWWEIHRRARGRPRRRWTWPEASRSCLTKTSGPHSTRRG